MRDVTIKLGEQTYIVPQLTIRGEARWRKQAEEALAPFWDAAGLMQMDITQPGDLQRMVSQVGAMLDPTAALDAVCAYNSLLADDRERIEETAYSDEVIAALVSLFFGQLRQLERLPQTLAGLGQKPTQTISQN
jgi:hypothetical protein